MMTKEEMQEYLKEPQRPEFTEQEESYRRGFSHGVLAAIKSGVTIEEAYQWRHGMEENGSPGSLMNKIKLHGLTKDEPHRFFLNRLNNE